MIDTSYDFDRPKTNRLRQHGLIDFDGQLGLHFWVAAKHTSSKDDVRDVNAGLRTSVGQGDQVGQQADLDLTHAHCKQPTKFMVGSLFSHKFYSFILSSWACIMENFVYKVDIYNIIQKNYK